MKLESFTQDEAAENKIDSTPEGVLKEFQKSAQVLGSLESYIILNKSFSDFFKEIEEIISSEGRIEKIKRIQVILQKLAGLSKSSLQNKSTALVFESAGVFVSSILQSLNNGAFLEQVRLAVEKVLENVKFHQREILEYDKTINQKFNTFLFESEPVDQGFRSVIFRFGLDEQSEDFQHALSAEGVGIFDNDSAIKVLKIYQEGMALAEYERHASALSVIEAANKKDATTSTFSIPRPFLFHDIPLEDKTARHLESYHCSLPQKRAEILAMDFIDGKDFQHHLLSKALELKGEKMDFDKLDSQELYNQAGEKFDFIKILPNASILEQWRARAQNMSKIYHFLKINNVRVNPVVIKQMTNGLNAWKKAGFIHGDLHERNLMYVGGRESFFGESENVSGQTFAIDFGPLPVGEAEFVEIEQDTVVLNRLVGLNKKT